jgi:L-lactate dehydrogenase complex protein LldG
LPKVLPHHLTWTSGPSKTADIEQTLVIGAHGARSLTVIAYHRS